ncbi:DUF370 domain-containing protein [Bacillaceae bacterium IKA-2]|nr:DUF370 domain-containing protein [Bacillaceae bacterium IKA-2]
MFIHLGGDTVIRSKDIIAILDKQVKETSEITESFLNFQMEKNQEEEKKMDTTKAIVITKDQIYFSPISSGTLKRRADFVKDIEDL